MPFTKPNLSQVQTNTTKFDDPIIELNSALTGANTSDLGIVMNRGTTGNNVGIFWDKSTQQFVMVQTTADGDSSGDLTYSAYADLQVNSLSTANFTLPSVDGSDGQVLTTDGLGSVAWETIPLQNLWETITSDSGSTAANTATDTLTVTGGTGINTAVSGDTLTITNTSPNVDQNIWLVVNADAGTATANTTTDALTISGGTGISTSITGDTLTITNDSPNVTQNVFANIAVSGQNTVVADSATDTLTLVAGTNVTITTDDATDSITINAAGGSGIANVVEDTTPELGGTLDINSQNIVNGTQPIFDSTPPTNYDQAGMPTIENQFGANPAQFNLYLNIGAAYETIGPTGSGADNIWTAMDDIPAGAKFIILRVTSLIQGTTQNQVYELKLELTDGDIAFASNEDYVVSRVQVYNRSNLLESAVNTNTTIIPINSSRVFRGYLFRQGTGYVSLCQLHLVGWL